MFLVQLRFSDAKVTQNLKEHVWELDYAPFLVQMFTSTYSK